VQESYIDTFTAQVAAPDLFGGFSFHGFKKLKEGDSWIHSAAQRKEHSKTEFEKREFWEKFEESETLSGSKFSPKDLEIQVFGFFWYWESKTSKYK